MSLQLDIRYICNMSLHCSPDRILDLHYRNKSIKGKSTISVKSVLVYVEELC